MIGCRAAGASYSMYHPYPYTCPSFDSPNNIVCESFRIQYMDMRLAYYSRCLKPKSAEHETPAAMV